MASHTTACRLVSLALVLPVLLFLPWWFRTVVPGLCYAASLPPEILRFGLNPAPDWFVSALKRLPRREFNATELEQLSVDGVVPVRGLVADDDVLAELRRIFTSKYDTSHRSSYSGLMNALVRHSPLPSIASSSLGGKPVVLWNSQVEPRPARSERSAPYPDRPWMDEVVSGWEGLPGLPISMSIHDDVGGFAGMLHATGYSAVPLSSIFLALSDIPYSLNFIAGSHLLNQKHKCPHGPGMEGRHACFDGLWNESRGKRAWDLKAGDAVVFWGSTYHWTVLTELPRQALSVRYVPADMIFTGRFPPDGLRDMMPPACSPIGGSAPYPIMHPPPAPAPDLDLATGSRPGSPWPLFPRCPDSLGAMVRWVRNAIVDYMDWYPECGVVDLVTKHDGP